MKYMPENIHDVDKIEISFRKKIKKALKEIPPVVEEVLVYMREISEWMIDGNPKLTDMDDEITNIFYLPTDILRINKLSDEDAAYEIIGNRLYVDADALSIKYTYSNDDTTLYSPLFVMALATRLAAEICFNITQSAVKSRDILEKYESIDLRRAMAADSSQGSPEELDMTEWEESKL